MPALFRIFLLSAALLVLSFPANGQGYEFTYLSHTSDSSVLEVRLLAYDLQALPEGWVLPYVKGGVARVGKGEPELPHLNVPLVVSELSGVEVSVLRIEEEVLEGVRVAPSLGPLLRSQSPSEMRREKGALYSVDALFPSGRIELGTPYALHDVLGQSLSFSPFQYNPVTRQLRVAKRIVLALRGLKLDWRAVVPQGQRFSGRAAELVSPAATFAMRGKRGLAVAERGPMMIVTRAQYLETLDSFIHWKRLRGVPIEVVLFGEELAGYETVADTTALKNLLKNRYASSETLKYLLLVGSRDEVPPLRRRGAEKISDSDQAYGQIVGSDSYNEVYVGRFSARNPEHLATQIERTIWYERDVRRDATWLSTALNIASHEGGGSESDNGETDREHMRVIANLLRSTGYTRVDTLYETFAGSIPPERTVEVVNRGVGMINYVGHGYYTGWKSTGFRIKHVQSLTNRGAYPFLFNVACSNGEMGSSPCFAEEWLWARGAEGTHGALAICASSDLQDWMTPMRGQDAMVEYVAGKLSPALRTYGAVTTYGMARMQDKYNQDFYSRATADTWNVFGDPSVVLRTRAPEPMQVNFETTILLGSAEFTVQCDAENAEVALCLITPLGERSYHYSTVQSGVAHFQHLPLVLGSRGELLVWGVNRETFYTDEISVVDDTPYWVQFQAIALEPVSTLSPTQVQVGDVWGVSSEFCYVGSAFPGDNISLLATVDSPVGVSIIGAKEIGLEDFSTRECRAVSRLFQLRIESVPPRDGNVTLRLEARRGNDVVGFRNYTFQVVSSRVRIDSIRMVSDASGDGVLQAGENCEMAVWLKNAGDAVASGVGVSAAWDYSGAASPVEVPLGELGGGEQQRVVIPLNVPVGVVPGEVLSLGVEVKYGSDSVLRERCAFVVGEDYREFPHAVAHYPFAGAKLRQVTRLLVGKAELGAAPRRIVALRFPIHLANADRLELADLRASLQLVSVHSYVDLPPLDFEALFSGVADSAHLSVTKGYVTVDVPPFDYDGSSSVLLTIAAADLRLGQEYCVATTLGCGEPFEVVSQVEGGSCVSERVCRQPLFEPVAAREVDFSVRCVNEEGRLLRGVEVKVAGLKGVTNSSGETHFRLLEGNYTVEAYHELYAPLSLQLLVRGERSVAVCRLRSAPPMELTVLVHSLGVSVPNAELMLGGIVYTADAKGIIKLNLSPRDYYISLRAPGYFLLSSIMRVRKGLDTLRFDLKALPAGVRGIESSLAIWPNPAEDLLWVQAEHPMVRLRFFNVAGVLVLEESCSGEKEMCVRVGAFPVGAYLLEVEFTDGERELVRVVRE